MTMKRKLAIALFSMPLAVAPLAYAQTGGAVEGTTSPQSGNQTDMGTDGAPNNGGTGGATNNTGTTGSSGAAASGSTSGTSGASTGAGNNSPDSATGTSSSSATTGTQSTPPASAGESFEHKLKGKSVHNENDEKVGDVKDVVMSSDGKVTHVILGVGGFIGVGEHAVAIPYDEINIVGDQLTLRGYTKDQLKEMPAYERPRDDRAPATSPAPAAPMGATR